MARGKHATALFEVIHSAQKPPLRKSTSPGLLSSFFAPKPKSLTAVATPVDAMTAARAELASAKGPADTAEPRVVERIIEIEKPVYIDRPVPVPTRSFLDDDDVPLRLDPANREIKFRLSYVGAIAAAFILVVSLAMAYLIGSRSNAPEADAASAAESAAAESVPPRGTPGQSMMAAVSITPTPAPVSTTPADNPEAARADAPVAPVATPTLTDTPPADPLKVDHIVGQHYVIVQSYPDKPTAEHACAFLDQHGIACTVVPGPSGWAARGWNSVIGIEPFDHVQHNPALDAYKESIEALATQFAGNQRFIRFKPAAYKWTERSDTSDR